MGNSDRTSFMGRACHGPTTTLSHPSQPWATPVSPGHVCLPGLQALLEKGIKCKK